MRAAPNEMTIGQTRAQGPVGEWRGATATVETSFTKRLPNTRDFANDVVGTRNVKVSVSGARVSEAQPKAHRGVPLLVSRIARTDMPSMFDRMSGEEEKNTT